MEIRRRTTIAALALVALSPMASQAAPPVALGPQPSISVRPGSSHALCASDGPAIKVMVGRPADRKDTRSSYFSSTAQALYWARRYVDSVDAYFARLTGGYHLRWACRNGRTDVSFISLVPVGNDHAYGHGDVFESLRAQHFEDPDLIYLVLYDAGRFMYNFDAPAATGHYATVDSWYFGLHSYPPSFQISTALHELGHTLGAVAPDAPHSTGDTLHCFDGNDVMCYDDHSAYYQDGGAMTFACKQWQFDCGQDDYFNPSPAPGTYLAEHPESNVALSQWVTSP
jgi:hypothetical protein